MAMQCAAAPECMQTTITCTLPTLVCRRYSFSLSFDGVVHQFNSSLAGLLSTLPPNITAGTIHSLTDGLDATVPDLT